jgi:hypothetical protein
MIWGRVVPYLRPPAVHDGWNTSLSQKNTWQLWHDSGGDQFIVNSIIWRTPRQFFRSWPTSRPRQHVVSFSANHPPTRGTLRLNLNLWSGYKLFLVIHQNPPLVWSARTVSHESIRVSQKKYGKVFFIKIICVANLTSSNPMPTKATRDLAVCLPAPRSLDCAGGADVVCETTCRTNVGSFSNLEM